MAEGLQIDLDKGEGLVTNGHITDFIADPCTKLKIEFECSNLLIFTPDDKNYFRFLTLEWVPYTCELGQGSTGIWHYKIEAFPKQLFITIDSTCLDMQALASKLGVELGDNSENLPIKCPVLNLPAYAFMRIVRHQSFNDALIDKQTGKAYFIYCNSQTLTCLTWDKMTRSKANSLEIPEGLAGSEIVKVYDSRIESILLNPVYPKEWCEEDYLRQMNGVTFEMQTLQPALFAQMYTIKFGDNNQMDAPEPMLCFYTDCNIVDNNRMVNRYAQVNLK